MSTVVVEDRAWKAILADERLAAARRKLSFHEIRLIVQHTREASYHAELVEALRSAPGLPLSFDQYDRFASQYRAFREKRTAALAKIGAQS